MSYQRRIRQVHRIYSNPSLYRYLAMAHARQQTPAYHRLLYVCRMNYRHDGSTALLPRLTYPMTRA